MMIQSIKALIKWFTPEPDGGMSEQELDKIIKREVNKAQKLRESENKRRRMSEQELDNWLDNQW